MTRFRDSGVDWDIIGSTTTHYKVRDPRNHDVWGWLPKHWALEPAARVTDPVTSHQAAKAQTPTKVRSEHRLVLSLLQWEPLTDFDLAARASQALGRKVKQTSIGVRRSELVKAGLVRDSGTKGVSDTGSPAIRWCLTEAGVREAAA